MGHVCSCVKLDLNLDGGRLPLGISLWREILRTEATDHLGCDATVTGTSAESFCRLAVWSTSTPLLPKFAGIKFKTPKTTSDTLERLTQRDVDEGGDHWIANEDEKVLTRVHVEVRTELFIPIGANCPVRIKDLGRRRSTVLNYFDGSTEFVVDENWLQAENDRGGNHEWTGETHFDCDFDQIDEDEAEIYENEEYEPECDDEPDFVPTDGVEVEETSPPRRTSGTSSKSRKIQSSLHHPSQAYFWASD